MQRQFTIKNGRPILDSKGGQWRITSVKNKPAAITYFKEKIKIDGAFNAEPDGIYTWMLIGEHLMTTPVLNAQEVGALHWNIVSWIETKSDVISAGELRKKGLNVEFNLKSGSFMQPQFKNADIDVFDRLAAQVVETFAKQGITAVFLKCNPCNHEYEKKSGVAIVDTTPIITSPAEMEFLKANFVITSEEPEEPESELETEMGGGARRTRRQRRRPRGAKNLTRHRSRSRKVRQKK